MMIDDEKFFAWLDGELDPQEAAEVEAAVAADPALADRAEQHRALGTRLRAAFDPVAAQPAPLDTYLARAAGGNVASLADARTARRARFAPRFWPQAAAIAAVFVMGIATGNLLLTQPSSPIAPEAGRLVAAASLEEALYTRLASQPAADGPRIGLTFRDRSGDICRTFTDGLAAGLACHEEGDWRVRAVFQAPEGQASEYRMASAADPNLAAVVESTMAGDPFDAEQEKAARDKGWR